MANEPTWAPCLGWPGYEASSDGRIRSCDRIITKGNGVSIRRRGRVLKPWNTRGYQAVSLSGVGCGRKTYVHTLVCEAFHGPRSGSEEVRHLNRQPTGQPCRKPHVGNVVGEQPRHRPAWAPLPGQETAVSTRTSVRHREDPTRRRNRAKVLHLLSRITQAGTAEREGERRVGNGRVPKVPVRPRAKVPVGQGPECGCAQGAAHIGPVH